jgi:hypothetical protein
MNFGLAVEISVQTIHSVLITSFIGKRTDIRRSIEHTLKSVFSALPEQTSATSTGTTLPTETRPNAESATVLNASSRTPQKLGKILGPTLSVPLFLVLAAMFLCCQKKRRNKKLQRAPVVRPFLTWIPLRLTRPSQHNPSYVGFS